MATSTMDQYTAARHHAVLFDLSAASKIELAGPEALTFLHNLCTNDVKHLPTGGGCEAFLTTAKARVVAHVLVGRYCQDGREVVWLDSVPGQADKILQHLNHFLISEQVELTDRTDELTLLRLCGPAAEAIMAKGLGESLAVLPALHPRTIFLPNGEWCHVRRHDLLVLPCYDLFCDRDQAMLLGQILTQAGAQPAGAPTHEVLRVEAGFPHYGPDMDDNRFVVEVGRQRQAICYTKGCYLGQEPIVMARDRGQVNRTLLGVTVEGREPLQPGTRLMQGEAEVGLVTSAVFSPTLGMVIALAYVRRGFQEAGTIIQVDPPSDGRFATVVSLPFVPRPSE